MWINAKESSACRRARQSSPRWKNWSSLQSSTQVGIEKLPCIGKPDSLHWEAGESRQKPEGGCPEVKMKTDAPPKKQKRDFLRPLFIQLQAYWMLPPTPRLVKPSSIPRTKLNQSAKCIFLQVETIVNYLNKFKVSF